MSLRYIKQNENHGLQRAFTLVKGKDIFQDGGCCLEPSLEGRLARTVFYVDVSTSALPRNLIT